MQLRAQLHLEVAKCELASDFLAKATGQIAKAHAADCGAIDDALAAQEASDDEEDGPKKQGQDPAVLEEASNRLRPLDRFVKPLARKLELKSNLYAEVRRNDAACPPDRLPFDYDQK